MENIVSSKTAVKLKEAGFPQPEPDFSQIWYNDDGTAFLVLETFHHPLAYYAWINERGGDRLVIDNSVFIKMYFAPTATDILRLLNGCDLQYWTPNEGVKGRFYLDLEYGIAPQFFGENPAEVCAAAWLSLNAKNWDLHIKNP